MAELPVSESRFASRGKTAVGRLFVLELNAGRISFDEYRMAPTDCSPTGVAKAMKDKQHEER
jgi:hypothetical protein